MNMDEKLANLIFNYPAIWNRKSTEFKNNLKKENSFKALAKELNTSVEVVAARYKYLREKYRKEKERMEKETRSGAGYSETEAWPLYESLRFFDSVMLKRRTKTNLSMSEEQSEELVIEMETQVDMDPLDALTPTTLYNSEPESFPGPNTPGSSSSNDSSPLDIPDGVAKIRRLSKSISSPVVPILDRLVQAAEKVANRPKNPPADTLNNKVVDISRFLASSLTALDEDLFDDAVIELMGVVNKFKKEQRKRNNTN